MSCRKRSKRQIEAQDKDKCLTSIAEEYTCPISQELPVDPVVADDGRVYERQHIETWLRKSKRSPMTGLAMKPCLKSCVHIRNTIEQVVHSGAIEEAKCKAWLDKMSKLEHVKGLREKAEKGDIASIRELVRNYRYEQNNDEGYKWSKRGAQMRDPQCMEAYSFYLHAISLQAIRSKRHLSNTASMYYLTQAAEGGIRVAMYELGRMFFEKTTPSHRADIALDFTQAKYWLEKATITHPLDTISLEDFKDIASVYVDTSISRNDGKNDKNDIMNRILKHPDVNTIMDKLWDKSWNDTSNTLDKKCYEWAMSAITMINSGLSVDDVLGRDSNEDDSSEDEDEDEDEEEEDEDEDEDEPEY